ncbi:MAG: Crp/Fnr family transcriptional regulator, partial [Clostridia bacterium]|nr:Crp/Fnr family transcriptional regulator [Clostridia bacterium]
IEGKVQIYNLTSDGKKKILFILGRGNIANDSVFAGFNAIFCETLEKCTFLAVRRDDLSMLMQKDFALAKALMEYQERKIWRLEHQLKNSFGSIYLERKLASKLWRLARDFGIETEKGVLIDMELSITFLADLLGVPRENASRACKKLTEMGIISIDKKKIYLIDRDGAAYYFQCGKLPEKQ